jgi:DNA gyrase subunit B
LIYKHKGQEKSYHYNSLSDYFVENALDNTCKPAIGAAKTFDDNGEKTTVELVLTTASEPFQETFLNLTHLKENGAIYDGIVNGVKLFANKYARENKLFPKGVTSFSGTDIETSISFTATMLSNEVEFQNQTKFATAKKLYKDIAQKYVAEVLELFKIEQPKEFKRMLDHFLLVQKHNEKSSKAKQQLKKKLSEKVDGIGNKVDGLIDSKSHGADSEIFVAEGQSALGSVVLARDANYQAAIAIRGKILNCLKAGYDEIFENQIVTDLVKSFGCGIKTDKKNKDLENFDIKNFRYGKVIIATDADSDGEQIACLIITMIYRLMPDLITLGLVYIAQTPLYEVQLANDEMVYIYNEAEKDAKLKKITGKYQIARCKGLGELEPQVMSDTAMNPKTRTLVQVTANSASKMTKALDTWMGPVVDGRKEIIGSELHHYVENLV